MSTYWPVVRRDGERSIIVIWMLAVERKMARTGPATEAPEMRMNGFVFMI